MGREWEEKTNKKRLKELNKKDKDFYWNYVELKCGLCSRLKRSKWKRILEKEEKKGDYIREIV
jgi:hypothetical protein